VQEQVSIAVDNVMIEFSNYTVEQKLEEISKRLAFIRSIRDIAQGLEKALLEIQNGTPDGVVRSYIISQLKQNPVFWEIFSNNNYTELMALISPFVETGGVKYDYQFLSRPEVMSFCSQIIEEIHAK
jgi:predicted RNA-binding protein